MNIIEGDTVAKESKVAIAVSRFNRFINNNLLEGAVDVLKRVGCLKDENITVVWVPGAYELPLAIRALADRNQFDALIALGTIIRGVTVHFELITKECSCRLSKIAATNILPIGFGILTTDDIGQAIERAGIKANNKGSESALAVLEMINVLKMINE